MKNFKSTCTETLQDFVREHGEKKHRQIYDELTNSSSFKKNYPILTAGNRPPNAAELIVIVQNIRFFSFSNKRNTTIAAIILLMMWNGQCNSDNEICDDDKLLRILEAAIEKSAALMW
jgi:hypothetical protein